ncbi:hypothetical protein BGZ98_010362 [Dissophora globulifera]|nr:hypothetical protein BGZ98_010362 [Dissophora globulifera]
MSVPTQGDQSNDADGDSPLETDPTGRFQRLSEVLGEGAYKHVYKAFDQEEGVEVAWNQLRIDHLTKKEAQKILSEIEILESIRNDHIINFLASWSTKAPNGGERVVFITELMSSGTLKQYLKKTLKGPLKPKVLKSWCRQILRGLVYLHTHNPPIIHRDLKCDNIFINGNNGQLKIGDLGLAVVRHRTHVSSVLGTPEFMAPELYDEKYDEKVTKEYPYSECTNQAQIYRKVTKGIKPQSLDHVQDPETREFINQCLDHDDRTRPSAQELLDSDFLNCMPPICGPSAGLYTYPNRSTLDEFTLSSTSSPPSSISLPTSQPAVLPKTLPYPVKVDSQSVSIPGAAFTTTTKVDADNKTYHIRSNLVPQTPTSADPNPAGSQVYQDEGQDVEAQQGRQDREVGSAEPPTLHSHANTKTCSIQVVQYGEEDGDQNQLNLKMICTCPVAGPRDMTMAAGTHEIKFPFDLNADTVEEVVAEMIREQILSGDDLMEATAKIQDLIDSIVFVRKERARAAREERSRARNALESHHGADHTNRSQFPVGLKNGHHRQLSVPSVYDLEQYGTSPTESLYDHYSSVGSSTSTGWTAIDSPIESDQGYGTVPPQTIQQAPIITESTFPPLSATQAPRLKSGETVEEQIVPQLSSQQQISYSDVVQHPVDGQRHPLSPNLNAYDRSPARSRRHSHYSEDPRPITPVSSDARPVASSGALTKHALREIDAASADKKKSAATEDVGYTSPYRHGVSSSSINYHRRSPSLDVSVHAMSPASTSVPVHTSPSEPSLRTSGRMDQHRLSVASVPSVASVASVPSVPSLPSSVLSPEIRPTVSRDSSTHGISAMALNGHTSQTVVPAQTVPSDSELSSGAFNPKLPLLVPYPAHLDRRVPQSGLVLEHELSQDVSQKPPRPSYVEPLMTNEAKKDIELWSNRVQNPEGINSIGYTNGSSYSSGAEMSDDEDVLDEDLKILREKQRQELELMRLQHVQQWEKMMKLKEQKCVQERVRRKSEVNNNGAYFPATLTSSTAQQ